jgi:hypothetical protein
MKVNMAETLDPDKKPSSVQIRITPEVRRQVLIAAALFELSPNDVIDAGMEEYAKTHAKKLETVKFLGSMGYKPTEQQDI